MSSAAAEWVVGSLLTRGKTAGQNILTAANDDTDILCQGDSRLSVEVDMAGGASGDLTVQIIPFEADAVTLLGVALAPIRSTGPTFAGARVSYVADFDVSGFDKVRFRMTNNNVATQVVNRKSWRLS